MCDPVVLGKEALVSPSARDISRAPCPVLLDVPELPDDAK